MKWYRHMTRVRYAETDQMGVVYHVQYLNWMEVARTELIRHLGMPYKTIEDRGLLLPVMDVEVNFKLPAKYDELISIYTRLTEMTGARLTFAYEIRREQAEDADENITRPSAKKVWEQEQLSGDLLVVGLSRHVWTNKEFRPQRLDKKAPDVYQLIADYYKLCRADPT